MTQARLIIDGPTSGSRNMAVDQALLQTANRLRQITLRLYQWKPATLSLGYFQKYEDRRSHAASAECPVVRRASGGGAIVHDHEWTYSVTLPAKNRLSQSHEHLVEEMHGVMIELLGSFGLQAELHQHSRPSDQGEPPSFLCFQRRAVNDLIVGQHKICGSAQRRTEGAILQHGSLLYRCSDAAPELLGFLDLLERPIELGEGSKFLEGWMKLIGQKWQLQLTRGQLTETESVLAGEIEKKRFAADSWTKRR